MEKINFNAGWTHYREGSENQAVIINLPHDAMIYEDRIHKRLSWQLKSDIHRIAQSENKG